MNYRNQDLGHSLHDTWYRIQSLWCIGISFYESIVYNFSCFLLCGGSLVHGTGLRESCYLIFIQTKQSKRVVRPVPSAMCHELCYPHKATGNREREWGLIYYVKTKPNTSKTLHPISGIRKTVPQILVSIIQTLIF